MVSELYTTTLNSVWSWPTCQIGEANRPRGGCTGATGTTCPWVMFGVLMICHEQRNSATFIAHR
jgi:hypothetical protein